jgi:hypothetical protein
MSRRCTAAVALLALAAAPLAAQEFNEFCRGNPRLTVGQWSSYRYEGGRADGTTMRMAIVGSERQSDSTFLWYEMKIEDGKHPDRGPTITQILVSGLGTPDFSIHGMVMKAGDHQAIRYPDMMLQMMAGPIKKGVGSMVEQKCKQGSVQVLGWETVSVPAGSFRALHFRDGDDEAWLSPELGFPLVKYTSTKQGTMELTGHGADAKSSITETPQSMMR